MKDTELKKIKVIALFGPSGSGKDTIRKELVEAYKLHPIVGCTTRPKREGEIDGVTYHFLTIEQFSEQVLNGEMIEATDFNNWFYGTQMSALSKEKVNVGIFNLQAIECLLEMSDELEIYPVCITASDGVRLIRNIHRNYGVDCEEICRRFLTDKKDFAQIDFPHWEVTNDSEQTPLEVASDIYDIL